MEPEIRHSENGSDRNQTTSGGPEADAAGTLESWQTSSLLLWLPHLSISFLLLVLVLLSFVRFHSKHGHKYRKPSKGPRPAWQQELGMHDFIRHLHSAVTPPLPPPVTPPAVDLQVFGWYDEEQRPPPPPLPIRSIPDLSAPQSSSLSSSLYGNAESANSKRRQVETAPTQKEDSPNSLTSAISSSSSSTPRISIASTSSSGAEVTSSSLPQSNNSDAATNCREISRDVASSQIDGRSKNVAALSEVVTTDKSGSAPANPLPPSEPAVQSSPEGRGAVSVTAATPTQQKNLKKPLFSWTLLGTDKVRDSVDVDGAATTAAAAAAPRIPPRTWMTTERNRASEVVLRSAGPLRAITTVALSKTTSSEDEEKLIEKSPI